MTRTDADAGQAARPRLLAAARSGGAQPAGTTKVVAGWNGLAVAALAEAGAVLARPELVDAADDRGLPERVHCAGGGRLVRVSHDGVARGIGGLLEDYAMLRRGIVRTLRGYRAQPAGMAGGRAGCRLQRFAADGSLKDAAGDSAQVTAAQGGRDG